MTIALDWQIELPARSLLIGAGTAYDVLSEPYPQGFVADYDVRSTDSPNIGHGDAFGDDHYTSRLLQLTVGSKGSPEEARGAIDDLRRAWRITRDLVQLDVQLPGAAETILSFFGRPRQAVGKGDLYVAGWLAADLEFIAEPYAYGELRTIEDEAGTITIPAANCGDEGTRSSRMTITIDANGGTPVIVNTTDNNRGVTFTEAVASDVVLDLNERTAMQGSTSVIGQTTGWWPELVGGVDNVLTVSGCTGVTIAYRPAYF